MLIKLWGAEKVAGNWSQLFSQADIFTLMYDESTCGKIFPKEKIHTSCFSLPSQKLYQLTKKQRLSLPLIRRSVRKLDFSQYDIVLVSSSWFAHALKKSWAKTIVYYHAPARYMWDWTHEYRKEIWMCSWIKWFLYGNFMKRMRMQDYLAAQDHDIILANSVTTQKRIFKYYRQESQVLFPPIETQRFAKKLSKSLLSPLPFQGKGSTDYYIILSALTEFKRLDIAIKNFKNIPETNLVIIGAGEYRSELEKLAKNTENIFFTGAQFWDDLVTLVQNSLGLIFPGEEDFWIVPIEVMAAGKPVFALKKWWLTETVVEGKTWEFFKDAEWWDFIKNFTAFHKNNLAWKYTSEDCKKRAREYDKKIFKEKMQDYIKKIS